MRRGMENTKKDLNTTSSDEKYNIWNEKKKTQNKTLSGINNRLDTIEEKIREFEDINLNT